MDSGDKVLGHDTRRAIFTHILLYPGVQFTVLKRIFDLTEGTLRYHLRYLEKNELIREELDEGKKTYYPCDRSFVPEGEKGSATSRESSKAKERLVNTIRRYPGIRQKDLAKRTRMNRFTLMYNVNKLISDGLVKKYYVGREVCYEYISRETLKREIIRRATIDLLNGKIREETYRRLMERLD
ncbi:MAG: helix-turn-helix domain-containing protein [Thermoplasmatota archaeon]